MRLKSGEEMIFLHNRTFKSINRFRYRFLLIVFVIVLWMQIYFNTRSSISPGILLTNIFDSSGSKDNIELLLDSSICNGTKHFDYLILVTSYVGHVELRSAQRRALPQAYLNTLNAVRIFLLAKIPEKEMSITQKSIDNEQDRHGDLIQGSFLESYRNLTFKHILGLNWVSTNCGSTQYIIKADDDIVFNLNKIIALLRQYEHIPNNKLLLGYVLNNTAPRRNKANKWFVTREEYSADKYPPYVSGWLYITTPTVIKKLLAHAKLYPFFWIDDIYVTGILAKSAGIVLQNLKEKSVWLEYYELLRCCLDDMVKHNIDCEYAVGPNGGNNNIFVEFMNAKIACEKVCIARKNKLKETCIVTNENVPRGLGQADIEPILLSV